MTEPVMSVVVLAYGDEPWLHRTVDSALASDGVDVDLIVVDNGATSDAVDTLPDDDRIRVFRPERNLGFAGGVNLGFSRAPGDILVMLNSDAVVAPDTFRLLAAAIADGADLAGPVVALADHPDLVNTAGNPLHVLGLVWAGHLDEPRGTIDRVENLATLSGACLAITREAWDRLDGFPEEFFAYHEDADLCWRARQQGMRLDLVHDASALHHYEFSRNTKKMYLMERNRLLFVLTTYSAKTLTVLAVPLVGFELALTMVAASQGWAKEKIRGWGWILRNLGYVRRRRAQVQAARTVPDAELYPLMTTTFDAKQLPLPPSAQLLEKILQIWWRVLIGARPKRLPGQ